VKKVSTSAKDDVGLQARQILKIFSCSPVHVGARDRVTTTAAQKQKEVKP
jgi:hypothetical protein